MIYQESLDKKRDAVTVNIYCTVIAYDKMYEWCINYTSNNKFASIIECTPLDYIYFECNNGGSGTFFFEDEKDALLFRLRWGHEVC